MCMTVLIQVRWTNTQTQEVALYGVTSFKNGNDVRMAIEDLRNPTIKLPDEVPTDDTLAAKRSWEMKVDEFTIRQYKYSMLCYLGSMY